jgi:DNA-binding CsgD family transcriptional regulator
VEARARCAISVDAVTASDGLSPRELEIARLVARGATNRMIASVLEISTWTVSTHLRRIFAKLGVASGAEMVATLLGR